MLRLSQVICAVMLWGLVTAVSASPFSAKLALKPLFPAGEFHQIIQLLPYAHTEFNWLLAEKTGRISVLNVENGKIIRKKRILQIQRRVHSRPSEAGLLGIALSPQFPHEIFVSYTGTGQGLESRLSRFIFKSGEIDPDSEQILLRVAQPYSNHNGGGIAFGQDGALYLGLGDGGSGGDPKGHGQNKQTLLGSMLRIQPNNVLAKTPYSIPKDNPFAKNKSCQEGACPEIYAWGLRNPWRWSFDRLTGELWAGDVGQNDVEEINRIHRGKNYGWNIREGDKCYASNACAKTGLTEPVAVYGHDQGCSVTGGYVYRGKQLPDLYGYYLYSDFCTGTIWALDTRKRQAKPEILLKTEKNISGFVEDAQGELYIIDYMKSGVYQLTRADFYS